MLQSSLWWLIFDFQISVLLQIFLYGFDQLLTSIIVIMVRYESA